MVNKPKIRIVIIIFIIREASLVCSQLVVKESSLHWLILGFLYAFFLQWSIFPIKLNSYPIPPPQPPSRIFKSSTILLFTHTQCSFVSYTHIYKPCSPLSFTLKNDSFHAVNRKWLRREIYTRKREIWEWIKSLETTKSSRRNWLAKEQTTTKFCEKTFFLL